MNTFIFIVSQLTKPFLKVENVLAITSLVTFLALIKNWRRTARISAFISIFLVAMLTYTLPAQILVSRLENQFMPPNGKTLANADGIIVLGGAILEGKVSVERNQILINDNAERLTTSLMLMRQYPNLNLVYSTFSGQLLKKGVTENLAAQKFYTEQGISKKRLRFESNSRNTFENATESFKLVRPEKGSWILVTSATHIPRSVISFNEAGWSVIPYPVDFQTGTSLNFTQFNLSEGIKLWNRWLYEAAATLLYKLRFKAS